VRVNVNKMVAIGYSIEMFLVNDVVSLFVVGCYCPVVSAERFYALERTAYRTTTLCTLHWDTRLIRLKYVSPRV
jgi:hypothetical protein